MTKNIIFLTLAIGLVSCQTTDDLISQGKTKQAECKAAGGTLVFDRESLTVKCVVVPVPAPKQGEDSTGSGKDVDPGNDSAPPPNPAPEPGPIDNGAWTVYRPGEFIQLPPVGKITFEVTGIDSRNIKEWHILDIAHGRGRGVETSNAHLMIYDDKTLYLIQQVYKPKLHESRHEDYWAFRPEKIYRFTLVSNPLEYRLQISENGKLVVDMNRAQIGPWPVAPFAKIDNMRIGCGVFSSHSCPNPIKIRIIDDAE